eukprot:8781424-Pyramimonas_sp.AAC.3
MRERLQESWGTDEEEGEAVGRQALGGWAAMKATEGCQSLGRYTERVSSLQVWHTKARLWLVS